MTTSRYALVRALAMIPTLLGAGTAVFVLIRLVPGTVVEQILGTQGNVTEAQRAALRAFFGLDQPILVQYGRWLTKVLTGDLGHSWVNGKPVSELLLARLPVTLELTVLGMAVALVLGLPLGMLSAIHRGSKLDAAARILSLLGLSVPEIWQATMMILLFSLAFHWMPPTTFVSPFRNPTGNLLAMIWPAITLGTVFGANIARLTRSSTLEQLRFDYVRTARAKGLAERVVLLRHVLKNALIPILTLSGLGVGYLLGGAVIVEEVFTLPGMGRLLLTAIYQRDYPLVQGAILFIAFAFALANMCIDILYAYVDPRIRDR